MRSQMEMGLIHHTQTVAPIFIEGRRLKTGNGIDESPTLNLHVDVPVGDPAKIERRPWSPAVANAALDPTRNRRGTCGGIFGKMTLNHLSVANEFDHFDAVGRFDPDIDLPVANLFEFRTHRMIIERDIELDSVTGHGVGPSLSQRFKD